MKLSGFFSHYHIVKRNKTKPSRVREEAALAVAAGSCRRGDFHVLAENGLEGLVSMHHGTEHQRLAGGNAVAEPQ